MGNLFAKKSSSASSSSSSKVTQQDKAVLQLKQQRDKIKQYQKRIEIQLQRDQQIAKQLVKANKKSRALLLLRKKKFQESLLSKTDDQLSNINQLIQDIEFAQIEQQVLSGLEEGNKALKTLNQLMSLDRVEQIMDETQEAVEYQREISSILSGGLSREEEDDVEAELEELLKLELPEVPAEELEGAKEDEDINLPDVPRKEPGSRGRTAVAAS